MSTTTLHFKTSSYVIVSGKKNVLDYEIFVTYSEWMSETLSETYAATKKFVVQHRWKDCMIISVQWTSTIS